MIGGSVEWFLRSRGHLRSVTDGKNLWSMEMSMVVANEADLAIAGDSRMALDFQSDHFELLTGKRVANLSIDGSSPLPVIDFIANETDFSGVVLVNLDEASILFEGGADKARSWTEWHTSYGTGAARYNPRLNTMIQAYLQSRLVMFSANCGWRIVERINDPIYLETKAHRSKRAFYREMLIEEQLHELKQNRMAKDTTWMTVATNDLDGIWTVRTARLKSAQEAIRSRGGQLVFIRLPTTGELGELFDRLYPRDQFWNALGPMTGAETIHFQDHPAMSEFDCPDGSHLNYDDALHLTGYLATLPVLNRSAQDGIGE